MKIDISGTLARISEMDDVALSRLSANVDDWLDSGDDNRITAAETVGAAVQQERARRATLKANEHEALMAELDGADQARRVRVAFEQVPATPTDIKVITALLRNPGATSRQLSQALGWGGQIWHTHFGLMCRAREAWLWPAEDAPVRDAKFYSGILADLDTSNNTWTARPDIEPELARIAGIRQ